MPIEVKQVHAANTPVKVDETKDSKPLYCACCEDHKTIRMSAIRGSAYELRNILPGWFASLGIKEIISHAQSESEGNLTVSIVYR